MKQGFTFIFVVVLFFWLTCRGQEAPGTFVKKGNFTNVQMNENVQSIVNSCSPAEEFHKEQNGKNSTDAISGCIQVPKDSTVWGAQALAGYGNNSSKTTNAVGVYASMRCLVTQSHCWGSNPLVSDSLGTASSLIGEEIDINVSGSPSQALGLQITGYLNGTLPASANAIWVTPAVGSANRWPIAVNIGDGAANTGLYLGTQQLGNNRPSSIIRFAAMDNLGGRRYSTIGTLPDGSLQFTSGNDVDVAGHANLAFTGDAGQHLTTARANSDTAGQVSIKRTNEGFYAFHSPWGVGTPPVCTVTPTTDPTKVGGSWWITYATDSSNRAVELHVHVHNAGTIDFNYICVGNPR